MNRKLTLALVSCLAMGATGYGNAGPARLPKDQKVAEPPVQFEGIDKHADYVFHLSFHIIYVGSSLVEVKDSNAFKLDFKRTDISPSVSYMALLAMERKAFEQRKKEDPSLKWLTTETDGVLEAKLTPPKSTVPITVKEIPVTTYRVKLENGKLSATKVETKKGGGEEPIGFLPPWVFAMVGSFSIAWLGVWFAQSRYRKPNH